MSFSVVTRENMEALRAIVGQENCLWGEEISPDYAHDELGGVERMPDILLRVHSTEEVSRIMAYADTHRLPVVVRGSGTGLVGAAVALGLPVSWNLLAVVGALIPSALLFIGLGLLCGALFNDRQVGGACGALLTNVTAWLAGIWFDLSLMGGGFKTFAYLLPFAHGADGAKAALAGDWAALPGHLLWVCGWAAVVMAAAVRLFRWKMVEH